MRVVDGAASALLLFIVGGEMPRRRREPGDAAAGALFAERLNSLFATRPDPATGQPYSLRDVSAGTAGLVSRAYLSTLRRGGVAMPGLHIIEALARFFGVPTGYFLGHDTGDVPRGLGAGASSAGDQGKPDEEAVLRLALADPLVKEIALKVKDFGPEEWRLMIGMVESQMALRRLAADRERATPPPPPSPPSPPPPRDISTGRRRSKKRDDTGRGGDTTE